MYATAKEGSQDHSNVPPEVREAKLKEQAAAKRQWREAARLANERRAEDAKLAEAAAVASGGEFDDVPIPFCAYVAAFLCDRSSYSEVCDFGSGTVLSPLFAGNSAASPGASASVLCAAPPGFDISLFDRLPSAAAAAAGAVPCASRDSAVVTYGSAAAFSSGEPGELFAGVDLPCMNDPFMAEFAEAWRS